jgi:hypothetical protein
METINITTLRSNANYKTFILSIISELEKYPKKHKKLVYIGGTTDSNQSSAEHQYCIGVLGVTAYSKKVGYALIMILQMIIDDNYDLILFRLDPDGEKEDLMTMKDIINEISQDLEGCYSIHPFDEKSEIDPKKMNLWSLKRIKEYLNSMKIFDLR